MIRNTMTSYGSAAKFFHWLIFILLFCMITFGFFLEDVPKDYQPVTYNIHKLTGLAILVLMLLRGIWALMNPKPVLPFGTPNWQRYAEHIVHFSLYALVIAMPLVGWIGSSAAGRPPHIGEFVFMLSVQQSKALVEACFEAHEVIAFLIIFFVTIHVAAALYHYFIKNDGILERMLPGNRR